MRKNKTQEREYKLYAYKIESNKLTTDNTDLINMLRKTLNDSTTAEKRLLKPSKNSLDEDLLADFDFLDSGIFYGVMMRLTDGALTGGIPSKSLKSQKIQIKDLKNDGEGNKRYRSIHYFVIKHNHIVATTRHITGLNTYINWLIERIRGESIYTFSALLEELDKLSFSEVKQIDFGPSIRIPIKNNSSKTTIFTIQKAAFDAIKQVTLFGRSDGGALDRLLEEDCVEAKIVLKIASRPPKGMKKEEYKEMLSSFVTTCKDGLTLTTKEGKKISGESCHKQEGVKIELTSDGQISEEQLKQEMERFINKLG